MKVAKNIVKVLFLLSIMFFLSGCKNNYEKLAFTSYNEYFQAKDGYFIIDQSSNYGVDVARCYEAGDGNVQVFYLEFIEKQDAIEFVNSQYEGVKGYKLKTKDNYSYVKSTKGKYFKLYRVDNVILYAISTDKSYKKEINNILKDLGY